MLGADTAGLMHADWHQIACVAAAAALLSVLTSIASGPVTPTGTPSLVGEHPIPDTDSGG
jgi:hypothetical protein